MTDAANDTSPDDAWRRHVAAAVLLLSAARIDGHVSAEEVARILEGLRARFDLSHEAARHRLDAAHTALEHGPDLPRTVAQALSDSDHGHRRRLLATLRAVIYADGVATPQEAALLSDLSQLMGLSRTLPVHEARRRLRASLTPDAAPGRGAPKPEDDLLPHLRPPTP